MGRIVEKITPDLIRGLMAAHGIESPYALAKRARVSNSVLYEFLSGRNKTLGVSTRRKLAALFPGSRRLFVADIIDPEAT